LIFTEMVNYLTKLTATGISYEDEYSFKLTFVMTIQYNTALIWL